MPLDLSSIAQELGIPAGLLIFLLIWTAVWKALALWKSGRLNQPVWFILLFVINTFGILEILYIFLFSRMKLDVAPAKENSLKKRVRRKSK